MDYSTFREKIKWTTPTPELAERLIEGEDSIHAIFILDRIEEGRYTITLPVKTMDLLLRLQEELKGRGAVQDQDFFIGGNMYDSLLTIELHTTHKFLSEEDIL
jgi:hypothetical protein